MKILIATNMYPTADAPWLGVFVRQQELSLRALGVEVEVAAHVGRPSRARAYAAALPDLVRRLRRGGFDLIHSHHTYSTLLTLAARRLAGARAPVVMTFHESEVFSRGTDLGEDALRRRVRHSMRLKALALRGADFVIPVQRDMLRAVLGEAGAARIPARVIPAGIDLGQFAPEPREAARQRLGWAEDGLVVFFPCDPVKPEKRADLARAGFERFARAHPGARLVVGGGVPYERMGDTLRASDIILVPTEFEASPTVVKEALACERPVVSTDVGDVREAYGALPGVVICDWTAESVAEGLERALGAPAPYGGRARLLELGLGLDQVAGRLLEVYHQVALAPGASDRA